MLYDQISTCIDAGPDGDISDRVPVLLCTVCSTSMLIETKIFKLMQGLSKESEIQCCACTLMEGRGHSQLYCCEKCKYLQKLKGYVIGSHLFIFLENTYIICNLYFVSIEMIPFYKNIRGPLGNKISLSLSLITHFITNLY